MLLKRSSKRRFWGWHCDKDKQVQCKFSTPTILPTVRCSVNMSYQVPRKAILSKDQLQAFQESKTHKDVISYIEKLNESVVGVKLSEACEASDVSMSLSFPVSQIQLYGRPGCKFSSRNFGQS